jgi:regulator of replication initiation timing
MNKKILMILISDIVIFAAFAFIIYQDNLELERLKSISETYAKENESLKIDLEMLRKKFSALESSRKTAQSNDFALLQQQKFNAMKDEIQRLKAENKPDNKEREDQVWDLALENVKFFVDIELTKRLASFGFKPEETEICVTEYKNTLEKSKDVLLQWYRNEITDTEYKDEIMRMSREFYDTLSASVGENLASITISVVLPDYEFRKKMFEEK